ncbi:hypothetical protein QR680_002749 [Steinernema hermaphroditum]|uniref:PAZ domain-containing protein n=1 Tax=Steinernema hermaphroditum TaxID=289476 RepID=A0AA39H4S9_9BILA|nr:hypothetical protein QR680_002749 [Steinernema hermaphroditum]
MDSQQCCELCGCVMTEKKPRGSSGRRIELQSNVNGLSVKHIRVYRYDVTIISRLSAFEDKSRHELVLSKEELAGHPIFGDLDNVALELKKRTDLIEQDHSLQQFLELLTSRHVLFTPSDHICYESGRSFLLNHKKYDFQDNDYPELGEGKYLAVGSHKSVRFIEGPKRRANAHAAVVVDTRKAAFHNPECLINKAMVIVNFNNDQKLRKNDVDRLKAQLKGVFVQATHSKHPRVFPIAAVTEGTTVEKVFDEGQGGSITLIDYCELKYDIALRYPSAPLIVVNGNRQTNYYPWKCATSVAISV